ncbi:PDGLE domain-containing protein [Mycolicibacterium grossiae]|uniref:PDGLE domain-containing protein n=1 Tax=Mycolicibacterium grossiae TaxID=1552759 RepID=A0A1E8Q9D4_9MYCO|nr:PDGLE domain-containing protein [Mycolicibacterium grossiae]OFJ55233.1 hypothetical protein BEL07_03435 [Mycolicibacterium grossiae]QEM46151.1 hypothetical protein FZ046_16500 [Mycolicibacterium grossiae]
MSAPARGRAFWVGCVAAILLIAGGVSYLASSSPDGLDATTLRGCEVVEVDGVEQLRGSCIAQQAAPHALESAPLADYAIGGREGTGGVAGVIGAVVTLALAGGAFWLIARRKRGS